MKDQSNILIIDDNEMNRDVTEGLIDALGYTAILAKNGKEALKLISLGPQPDLILLDILMPEMNGYEVLLFLKKDKNLRSIPVIMISVVDEMESVVKCIEAGAEDYLTKPFNAILLKARINACLEKKRLYDQEQKFNYWLAESYQKLQKAEETRDSLFQMIIHDMNNPLTVVLGGLDNLKFCPQKYVVDEHCASILKDIDIAARQIHSLVKCILDLSEMEQGGIVVSKTTMNAVEVIHDLQQQFEKEVSKKNGCLSFDPPKATILCHADKSLLTRILQNLLINAIKYGMTNTTPEITISIEQTLDKVRLCVQDNGRGIPEECMEHIFTKFYQIDKTQKGLGLGLTFCKMAAEVMGGTLTVENLPTGGSSFCLTMAAVE
jgi:K+-sensing histidine kinase KdpD